MSPATALGFHRQQTVVVDEAVCDFETLVVIGVVDEGVLLDEEAVRVLERLVVTGVIDDAPPLGDFKAVAVSVVPKAAAVVVLTAVVAWFPGTIVIVGVEATHRPNPLQNPAPPTQLEPMDL